MARQKIKKFSEKCAFSLEFSQFFINFNAYFWKITQNFRALPNSKISFHPRKIGPPLTFCGPPSTEKSCINYCILWILPKGDPSHVLEKFRIWIKKTGNDLCFYQRNRKVNHTYFEREKNNFNDGSKLTTSFENFQMFPGSPQTLIFKLG